MEGPVTDGRKEFCWMQYHFTASIDLKKLSSNTRPPDVIITVKY